jgi:hypothetical protein
MRAARVGDEPLAERLLPLAIGLGMSAAARLALERGEDADRDQRLLGIRGSGSPLDLVASEPQLVGPAVGPRRDGWPRDAGDNDPCDSRATALDTPDESPAAVGWRNTAVAKDRLNLPRLQAFCKHRASVAM